MKRKILVLFLLCSFLLLFTQKTLAEEVNLAIKGRKEVDTESSDDNILDYKQTEGANTELEFEVGADDPSEPVSEDATAGEDTESKDAILNDEQGGLKVDSRSKPVFDDITRGTKLESVAADTLSTEIKRAVDSPVEKDESNAVDLQATTNLLSKDKFNRENEFKLGSANESEIAKGREDKNIQSTEELTTEQTLPNTSETVIEATTEELNQIDEGKVTESCSEFTITEDIPTEIAFDPTTETPETTVTKNENTTKQKLCTTPGTYAMESDCRAYVTCTPTTLGDLEITPKDCPTGQAFDKALLRCSRDLSPCANTFDCKAEGTFADTTDNSSYYWCVASRLSDGLRIYHVKCGNGQIFTPQLGKCFVDMTTLHDLSLNYDLYLSKSPDEECVREEVKIMKAEEKVKLKETKLREKIQRKYEKELLKKAAKEAKEQAKLQGISLEGQTGFNCTQVGNFAAAADSFYDYFVCLSKKGNYNAVGMKCGEGQVFSAAKGFCTL